MSAPEIELTNTYALLHLSALNRSGEPNNRPRHQRVFERALTRYPLQTLRNLHARHQAVGAANADHSAILSGLDAANVAAGVIYDKSKSLLGHAVAVLHRSHDGGSECAKRVSETQKLSP